MEGWKGENMGRKRSVDRGGERWEEGNNQLNKHKLATDIETCLGLTMATCNKIFLRQSTLVNITLPDPGFISNLRQMVVTVVTVDT